MPLLTLACIILLPVVPAYFLFRALPTASGSVAGTLAGLKIKLGGAFAGYFAVVVLIFSTHNVWAPTPPPPLPPVFQVWQVSGQVLDNQGRTIEPLDEKDVMLTPPTFQSSPGGYFTLTFATMPAPGGGMQYPTLSVNYPNFQSLTIPLDPAAANNLAPGLQLQRDQTRQEINIPRIVLQKLPEYSAAGKTPPAPVPPGQEIH